MLWTTSCSRRRGSVAVLVAVCLTVLVAVVALALDGAMLLSSKRFAQSTADTAALAAASTIVSKVSDGRDSNGKARQAAGDAVRLNSAGRADLTFDSVSVRISPQPPVEPSPTITNGSGQLLEGYVEVVVVYRQPRYFSTIFGSDADLPVRARAVARGMYRRERDGVLVLDRDDNRALHVHGVGGVVNLSVTGADVDIIVNSNVQESPGAAEVGGGAVVTGVGMTVSGVESASGGGTWNMSTPVVRNAAPTPDPLRHHPPPDPSLLGLPTVNRAQYSSNPNGNNAVTLSPDVYTNGIKLTGNTGVLAVILEPGIYILQDGGFDVSGQVNVVGDGVLIYNGAPPSTNPGQSNGINFTGGATVNLTPLNTTDAYASQFNGMSLYVNRSSGTPISISGTAGSSLAGTVYAAGSPVSVTGNGDALIGWRYITRTLDVGGSGTLRINYDPLQPPRDRILQLVE